MRYLTHSIYSFFSFLFFSPSLPHQQIQYETLVSNRSNNAIQTHFQNFHNPRSPLHIQHMQSMRGHETPTSQYTSATLLASSTTIPRRNVQLSSDFTFFCFSHTDDPPTFPTPLSTPLSEEKEKESRVRDGGRAIYTQYLSWSS